MTDDSVILLVDAKKNSLKTQQSKHLFNILKQNLIQGVCHKYKKIRAIKILNKEYKTKRNNMFPS